MSSTYEVTCAIPRSGRTLNNFLEHLKNLGAPAGEIDHILEVMSRSKSRSSVNLSEVQAFLAEANSSGPACFGVFVDRKRKERPYRLGFLGHEWEIHGTRLRVEGDEPHNGSSLIKLDEVDFTVVGLDELLSMTQYYLRDPANVTRWGMYNYHLDKPTGIRVAGSAMLTSHNATLGREVQDMVGFFLISKQGAGTRRPLSLENLAKYGQNVYVKGRYSGIVMAAYPGLTVIGVEDVEDAVVAGPKGSVGIEIVQSGNTLVRKGLVIHGAPLFLSESLYVVDYDRFVASKALSDLIEKLGPVGYFDDRRIEQFALWYLALERNLGDSWIDRPGIAALFCELQDAENGLRPYRLQTRKWKPHDEYKRDDALQLVEEARARLESCYAELAKQ